MSDAPENSPATPTASRPSGSTMGVPVSIVLAGGLIALAIYFSGGLAPAAPAVPSGPPVPPEPVIGEFRPVDATDHVRGSATAKVTLIEYSDLECPFCKRFHPTMLQVMAEYPNDVRWVYRHFPLEQLHQQAKAESVAVECAGEQGKFWELLDSIYETTTSNDGLDLDTLPELAQEAGVANIAQFSECLESGRFDERIEADIADATVAGGRGTPYTVAIGPDGTKKAISGAVPYAEVKAIIDELL